MVADADRHARPRVVRAGEWLAARCPAAGCSWQGSRRRTLAKALADWHAHQRTCPKLGWDQPPESAEESQRP